MLRISIETNRHLRVELNEVVNKAVCVDMDTYVCMVFFNKKEEIIVRSSVSDT